MDTPEIEYEMIRKVSFPWMIKCTVEIHSNYSIDSICIYTIKTQTSHGNDLPIADQGIEQFHN